MPHVYTRVKIKLQLSGSIISCNFSNCVIFTFLVPRLTANPVSNEFLNGETITLECMPSVPDTELYWTYDTVSGRGNITTDTLSRSPFLSNSSFLHQLILPIANVSDTGSYSCVVPGPLGERQTISFIVVPGK